MAPALLLTENTLFFIDVIPFKLILAVKFLNFIIGLIIFTMLVLQMHWINWIREYFEVFLSFN